MATLPKVTLRSLWPRGFHCYCAKCCYEWGPRIPRAAARWIGHHVQARYGESYTEFRDRMRSEGHQWPITQLK